MSELSRAVRSRQPSKRTSVSSSSPSFLPPPPSATPLWALSPPPSLPSSTPHHECSQLRRISGMMPEALPFELSHLFTEVSNTSIHYLFCALFCLTQRQGGGGAADDTGCGNEVYSTVASVAVILRCSSIFISRAYTFPILFRKVRSLLSRATEDPFHLPF